MEGSESHLGKNSKAKIQTQLVPEHRTVSLPLREQFDTMVLSLSCEPIYF